MIRKFWRRIKYRITRGHIVATLLYLVIALFIIWLIYYWNSVLAGFIAGTVSVLSVVIGLGVYFLMHPGRFDKLLAMIYRPFRWISTGVDREYVRKDIEGVINSYNADEFGFEVPYNLRLRWESDPDRDSFLEDGDVVICLDDGDHQPENIANAAFAFTQRGVIPDARRHLNEDINDGLDFSITQNILDKEGKEDALRILYEDVISPSLDNYDGPLDENPVKISYDKIESTRKGGLLGPVLLQEYEKLTSYGMPRKDIQNETEEFLDFLEAIADGAQDEEPSLYFDGEYIDVAIGLMARSYVYDINPYIQMAKRNLAKAETSYILAVGQNIPSAKEVYAEAKELPGVESSEVIEYELDEDSHFGGPKRRFCARLERKEGVGL